MAKITIKEFVEFMAKIGFTPDPENWPNGYSDTDLLEGVGYIFNCDIDKNVWINAGKYILIESSYLVDDEIGEFEGTNQESLKRSFMKELLDITNNFDKEKLYQDYGCTAENLPDYEDGLGDPNMVIDPMDDSSVWYTHTLWCYRKQVDNFLNWALEIFKRLAKLETPLGELPDIDDDYENEDDCSNHEPNAHDAYVKRVEENLAEGMTKEEAEFEAGIRGANVVTNMVPSNMEKAMRKAVANGTTVNIKNSDGSYTDITDTFRDMQVNKVPEAEVLKVFPLTGNIPEDFSEEYNAHIQRQAERLNRVMGISIEDSLDQLKASTMRSVVGVVHQVIQAKAKYPDLDIDEFFNDNLYGNKLFPADIKDGLVYSDTRYPVSSSDPVIAREIIRIVHEVIGDDKDDVPSTESRAEATVEVHDTGSTLTWGQVEDLFNKIDFVYSNDNDDNDHPDRIKKILDTPQEVVDESHFVHVSTDTRIQLWYEEGDGRINITCYTDIIDVDYVMDFYAESINDIISGFEAGLKKFTHNFDFMRFCQAHDTRVSGDVQEIFNWAKTTHDKLQAMEYINKNPQVDDKTKETDEVPNKPTMDDFKHLLSKIGFEDDGFDLVAEGIDGKVWLCESMWENGLLIQTKYLVDDEIGEFHADSIDDIIPSFMAELKQQTCGFDKDAYYDRWEATEKYADEYESGPNARYYMTLECRIEEADAYYDWCCEVYSRLSKLK